MSMRRAVTVSLICLVILVSPGCADNADKLGDAARDQGRSQAIAHQAGAVLPLAQAQADAAAAKAKADEIAAIKAAAEQRAAASAAEIERLKAQEAKRQQADAAQLAKGGEVAGAVLPFVPAPYGELAGLVIGAVGGIGAWFGRQRAAKFKAIAEAIPAAIEKAQTEAGVVNFDDPATRKLLKAEIGPEAHALVRAVVDRVNAEAGARAAVENS